MLHLFCRPPISADGDLLGIRFQWLKKRKQLLLNESTFVIGQNACHGWEFIGRCLAANGQNPTPPPYPPPSFPADCQMDFLFRSNAWRPKGIRGYIIALYKGHLITVCLRVYMLQTVQCRLGLGGGILRIYIYIYRPGFLAGAPALSGKKRMKK